MHIIKYLFLSLILLTAAYSFSLKEKMLSAEKGDYVVSKQKNLVSLLFIREKQANHILLEEISTASSLIDLETIDWQNWLDQKAPKHTSWLIIDIDLENNKIIECYSPIQKQFIKTDELENFFIKLINLPLTYLEKNQQERLASYHLHQKLWQPPFIYEKNARPMDFSVYRTKLPKDFEHFPSKTLEMYYDKDNLLFFPTWLQVKGNFSFIMQTIDGGKNLISPITDIPHQKPQFDAKIYEDTTNVQLYLEKSPYYNECELLALDITQKPKKWITLPFTLKASDKAYQFIIDRKELKKRFENNHRYLFILSSKKDKNNAIQHPCIYIFQDTI